MSQYARSGDNLISVYNEYIFDNLNSDPIEEYYKRIDDWEDKTDHYSQQEDRMIDINKRIQETRITSGHPGLIDWATNTSYSTEFDLEIIADEEEEVAASESSESSGLSDDGSTPSPSPTSTPKPKAKAKKPRAKAKMKAAAGAAAAKKTRGGGKEIITNIQIPNIL